MRFFPAKGSPPEERGTKRILLRPLRAADVLLDYDAVMSSAPDLRRWSQSDWPSDDFTLAENLADLERHEREHLERTAFTFTVLDPDRTQCLGCVYLKPVSAEAAVLCAEALHAAEVAFWVRASECARDLDRHLLTTLREWFAKDWEFDCLLFPISPQETRQSAILRDAGLEMRLTYTPADGRSRQVFV